MAHSVEETPHLIATLCRIASQHRKRPAVEANDGWLSYGELDVHSNCLAHRLRAMGAGPGTTVGICIGRGARELVALLATLKAGAAYVPLDPSHPPERLGLIVEDASPEVIIVDGRSPLASATSAQEIMLDDLAASARGFSDAPLDVSVGPDALAYVMFTSGSTGRPKGVEIPRRALANFLSSMAKTPGLSEHDRLLAVTTTAFDIAGLELFGPLWVGATVAIADPAVSRNPERLRNRLEEGDITVMQATPATWRLLLEAGWTGDGKLRMLCGGEAMPPMLAERLLPAGAELWNMYGPTETTIWSSVDKLDPDFDRTEDRITIGRPIDHTTLGVVDEHMRPVPAGVEGELVIGGRGLARGYRGRPELTAERFVSTPDGGRLYRTGDLARELPDGRFECVGRLDHQVKIEGHRVELGEIESRLRDVPGVTEALVVADRPEGRPPRLVAYWVGTGDKEALVSAARRWLPAYMVPSVWILIDRFPLNANGKIDRKALPTATVTTSTGQQTLNRPRSDTETRIAAIWSDTLALTDVPRDQDFFTLGGTSALATEVVSKLRESTRPDLPLEALYEAPTIASLVDRVRKNLPRDRPIEVLLRGGGPDATPLHCVLGVHLYQDLALALQEDREVVGMHVPFRYVPGAQPRPSLGTVARRYMEVIQARQPSGPYHLLGLCFGGIVAYEVGRLLEERGERVDVVTIIDAVLPTAVRVDNRRRIRSVAGKVSGALRSPVELRRRFEREGEKLLSRVRSRWPIRDGGGEPIDLPVVGPEVDAEIERFSSRRHRLRGELLVVRATEEPCPPWRIVREDQGWGGRARRVRVLDVAADHLGVLKEPHVRVLARALDRQLSTSVASVTSA